jgi:predicted nucleic acid-binding protein
MIVADTNIIAYFYLPTAFTDRVTEIYRQDPHWLAPVLWRSEFRNVLALYLRKELIGLNQALAIQEDAELMMKGNEYEITSAPVLALVHESNCSSYDCEFVSLARQFNTQLVTQDKNVLREFPSIAVSIADFLRD